MKPVSTNEGKTPTAPEAGAGAAAGLGVTPADTAKATHLYKYEMPWRFTRKGGITVYIAICPACRKAIKPTRTKRSRFGTHGEEYYAHEHPLSFIKLVQSNSGNRSVAAIGNIPEELRMLVRDFWVFLGADIGEIGELINEWLEKHEVV
jgi:hypothetical protein